MFTLFALASFAGSLFASSLPLIPYPDQAEAGQGTLRVGARINIEVPSDDEEDRFAASLLVQDLSSLGGVAATVGAKGGGSPRIVLARSGSPAGKNILQQSGLSLPPEADEEGYILVVTAREASIVSKTAAGVFYGVQTLRQLLERTPGRRQRRDSHGAHRGLARHALARGQHRHQPWPHSHDGFIQKGNYSVVRVQNQFVLALHGKHCLPTPACRSLRRRAAR